MKRINKLKFELASIDDTYEQAIYACQRLGTRVHPTKFKIKQEGHHYAVYQFIEIPKIKQWGRR